MARFMRLLTLIALLLAGIIPLVGHAQDDNFRSIGSIEWNNAGTLLAVTYTTGELEIRDGISGDLLYTDIRNNRVAIQGFDWSPDNERIVFAQMDSSFQYGIVVFNTVSRQIEQLLPLENWYVVSIVWSPDGTRIAAAVHEGIGQSRDRVLQIWEQSTTGQFEPIVYYRVQPWAIVWSPDSSQIIVTDLFGDSTNIHNAETGALEASLPDKSATNVAWSPDGNQIATIDLDNVLYIWDATSNHLMHTIETGVVASSITWSPDSSMILLTTADEGVQIWDITTERLRITLPVTNSVRTVAWSPDGRNIAYNDDETLVFITAPPISVSSNQLPSGTVITAITWSPDGSVVAAGQSNGIINIWSTTNQQITATLTGHMDRVNDLAWDSTSSYLASVSRDQTLRVWDFTAGGTPLYPPIHHNSTVFSVVWNLDDTQIISIDFQSVDNLHIWDAMTGHSVRELATGGFFDLTFSPDGSRLAIANPVGLIAFRDGMTFAFIEDYIQYPERTGLGYDVYTVDWNSDGSQIVGGSLNGTVRIWDANAFNMILDLRGSNSQQVSFTTTLIYDVLFSADDRQVAAVSADGLIRVWDSHTGIVLSNTQLPVRPIYAARFSPDGTQIAYGIGQSLAIDPSPLATN